MFEHLEVDPPGSGWAITTQSGYSNPTNFIVPISGVYYLTYKIDVFSKLEDVNPTETAYYASVLTQNGTQINGSTSIISSIRNNLNLLLTNSVLVNLNMGDSISLLFWSDYIDSQIGDPTALTGQIAPGVVPNEATASIVIMRVL